jgi:hypothetical protein
MGTMPNCYLALVLNVTTNKHLKLGMWNWHELDQKIYLRIMYQLYVSQQLQT